MTSPTISAVRGQSFIPGAQWFNDVQGMLAWWKRQHGRSLEHQFGADDRSLIRVLNGTGDREAFDVVGIGPPLFEPEEDPEGPLTDFQLRPGVASIMPSYPNYIGRWGVLATPCKNGGSAPLVISGWVPVRLNVKEDWHRYAELSDDMEDDPYRLVSSDFGSARIIYKEEGEAPDELWAVIDIGKTHYRRMFKLKTALSTGGTATAYLCFYDESGPPGWSASEKEFAVFDPHGFFEGDGDDEDFHGERGEAWWNPLSRRFEIVQMQCGARFSKLEE